MKEKIQVYLKQLQDLEDKPTFSIADIELKKLKDNSGNKCIAVYVTDKVLEETSVIKLGTFMEMSDSTRKVVNPHNMLKAEDFNFLISKATLQFMLLNMFEIVDELPLFDEWSAERESSNLYKELLKDFCDNIRYIAPTKQKYLETPEQYACIFEPNFRNCGKACIIFNRQRLEQELALSGERFEQVMRFWKSRSFLYTGDSKAYTGRCQIKYRLGVTGNMHYAVVISDDLCNKTKSFYK